jgi:hypothetical protein
MQGSAAFGFVFAARRWVGDGSPITGVLLKKTASIGFPFPGARNSKTAQLERTGLDWGASICSKKKISVTVAELRDR